MRRVEEHPAAESSDEDDLIPDIEEGKAAEAARGERTERRLAREARRKEEDEAVRRRAQEEAAAARAAAGSELPPLRLPGFHDPLMSRQVETQPEQLL